ncbi:MAG: trypsin-like serine protease [Clostridiales bacterium]|nr:trypsin-like serine protease [Clostridiales bacterium]
MDNKDKQFVTFTDDENDSVQNSSDIPKSNLEEKPADTPAIKKERSHTILSKNKSSEKEKKSEYVTKKALVLYMVLSIVISTILGAGVGMTLTSHLNSNGSDSRQNLSNLSLSDSTGSRLTVSEIINKNEDSVVEIIVSGTTEGVFGQVELSEGAGSGVIINADGYIVTNYHVIEGSNKVQVTLHNGDSYSAKIVGGDSDNDIAVIKINAKDLTPVTLGDSSKCEVGDLAVAIGNPLGQLGGTATSGIISALDRRLNIDGRTMSLLQTDAAINPGNSGGGLFNGAGELIGIVDAKSSGADIEGLAFAIPINNVDDIINDLVTTGKVRAKPSIGIMIQDVSAENAEYYDLDEAGVYIAEITGDNAKKAGFKKGDRIISINNKKIENSSDLISRVRSYKIGDTVTVIIKREGQEISIKTVLEENNSATE